MTRPPFLRAGAPRLSLLWMVIAALAFSTVTPGAYGASTVPAAPTPSLSGVLTDKITQKPIPGAGIYVVERVDNDYESPSFDTTVYTDAQGYYSCQLPKAHAYGVIVMSARGYMRPTQYVTFDGINPLRVDFALDPLELKVTGTITDASTGKPLEGVFVQAMMESELEQNWTHTDSSGFYEIWMPIVPYSGAYKMRTRATGYRDANRFEIGQIDRKLPTQDFALEAAPPLAPDPFEPDNQFTQAKDIVPDGDAQVRSFYPDGDSEWIRLDAIAGLTYAIKTFDTHVWPSGPEMHLYESDGITPIGGICWRGYGTPNWYMQSVIEWTAPSTKTVYIHVTNRAQVDGIASPGSYGIYVVTNPPVAGADRYETSVIASKRAFPDGAEAVVIATGQNWPDALGGTALAGTVDGPILLVSSEFALKGTLDEITRLGASKVFVLGGEAAVGPKVVSQLRALPHVTNVERIEGASRYETANLVAERVIDLLGPDYDGIAFVTTGGNFPDALAAAPLAAATGSPLFLADPRSGLSAQTAHAMADVEHAIILGSVGAISSATQSQVTRMLGAGATVERISGRNRYETAANVASYGVREMGLSWDRVGVASGERFPDALAGGILQGQEGSVMLLTTADRLDSATASALKLNRDRIGTATFYGGTGALSNSVRLTVRGLLSQ